MTVEDDRRVDEARIRELLDAWVKALRSRDADAIVSRQAPDVVSFDVVNPLQYVGSGETRRRAEEWLSSFLGPIGLEIRDLSVTVGDDVAFAHSLNRVSGTMAHGQAIGMWLRSTVCFRKIDGQWTVTHQHSSVPFDGESGRASLDLKP
jgi:ketosteroid isomerase-like protein